MNWLWVSVAVAVLVVLVAAIAIVLVLRRPGMRINIGDTGGTGLGKVESAPAEASDGRSERTDHAPMYPVGLGLVNLLLYHEQLGRAILDRFAWALPDSDARDLRQLVDEASAARGSQVQAVATRLGAWFGAHEAAELLAKADLISRTSACDPAVAASIARKIDETAEVARAGQVSEASRPLAELAQLVDAALSECGTPHSSWRESDQLQASAADHLDIYRATESPAHRLLVRCLAHLSSAEVEEAAQCLAAFRTLAQVELDQEAQRAARHLEEQCRELAEQVQEMGKQATVLRRQAGEAHNAGRHDEALHLLRQALDASGGAAAIRRDLSMVLTGVAVERANAAQGPVSWQLMQEMEAMLGEATQLDPSNTHAHENLEILKRIASEADAQVSEYGGLHAFELRQQAVTEFNADHHDEAIRLLRQALEVSRGAAGIGRELSLVLANVAVGRVNAARGKAPAHVVREAVAMLTEATQLDPNNAHARQNLQLARDLARLSGLEWATADAAPATSVPPRSLRVTREARAGSPAVPGGRADRVHFAVTSPSVMAPKTTHLLSVWAYLEQQRGKAIRMAREEAAGRQVAVASKGPFRVGRGVEMKVRLRIPEAKVDPLQDTILWEGEIGKAQFAVTMQQEATPGTKQGVITVHVAGHRVARLLFVVNVGIQQSQASERPTREHRCRTAFACYADEDQDAVLPRLQGLQKAIPNLNVFFAPADMRSGEKWKERLRAEILARDVMYLFWSRAASQSEWVDWEWRLGLQERGIDFIDPFPLVSPKEVPPPKELADELHFNDWMLAYTAGSRQATG